MRVCETSKFQKLRKKLRSDLEREALKHAIGLIVEDPMTGKKLKGEFKDLRRLKYVVGGQERRLIYKIEYETITLISFGPREGVYK